MFPGGKLQVSLDGESSHITRAARHRVLSHWLWRSWGSTAGSHHHMGVIFCFGTLSCIITCSVLPLSSILGRSPRNAWVHVVPQSSLPETAQGKRKQSEVTLFRPISRGTKFEHPSSHNSLPAGAVKRITLGRSTRFDNNNNNMLDLALNCLSHWDDWIRLLPAQETGRQGRVV